MSDPTTPEPDTAPVVDPTSLDSAEASPLPAADAGSSDTTTASSTDAEPTVVDTPTDQAEVTPITDPSGATTTDSETAVSDTSAVAGSPDASDASASPSSDATPDPIVPGDDVTEAADPQPSADLLTGGTYDGEPGSTGPSNDPTATGIADGKDGASPTENQGTIEQLPAPGVDSSVSLSPGFDGTPTGLDTSDDAPDTTPVITQPEDATTPDGLETTFVTQSTLQVGVAGSTPQFTGTKLGSVISVRKVGWVGADTFDVHEDSIDELVGLLDALKDA